MTEQLWYYLEAGAEQGPVSAEELTALLRGRLPRGTLVWRDGFADWTRAEDVPELGVRPSPPPPPPAPPPIPRQPRSSSPHPARSTAAPMPLASPGEVPSYNPFVLWRQCFAWSGRFDRGQFAIAYLGQIVATAVLFLGVGIVGALLSGAGAASQDTSAALGGAVMLLALPLILIVGLGAIVRRLHDLGQSGWLALLMLLPCLNFVLVIYLLAAPGSAATGAPAAGMPAIAIVAVVALLLIPIVGIVAAIAIPSLLRARVAANEAATIGDIRSVVSAEAAYQTANAGRYGTITCLATPSGCLAGYTGPTFLDASLAQPQTTKNGYVRRWVERPARGGSPGSIESFCYSATPAQPNQTGVRSFGGDSSGLVGAASGSADCCSEQGLDVAACPPLR